MNLFALPADYCSFEHDSCGWNVSGLKRHYGSPGTFGRGRVSGPSFDMSHGPQDGKGNIKLV